MSSVTGHARFRTAALVLLLAASIGAAGCESPEANRTRGGGPGGDVGNRPKTLKMHEGSNPFWKTPQRIGTEHPPLAPARQAEALSNK